MKIVLVGGGSGGHITPTLAVAAELKKQSPNARLIYVIGKGDKLQDVVAANEEIDDVRSVHSGKFRRYHGEGLRQLLDIPTMLKNLRDFFLVLAGIIESFVLLHREKPDVVFIKGGFVGVPVGLMAALKGIPFVTHDSDAIPGLANRLIGRWAAAHAVAMPVDVYSYPKSKTLQVGVPISEHYVPVTASKQAEYREALGLDPKNPVICVTGGGTGAQRLNEAVAKISKMLLARHPRLHILHVAGKGKTASLKEMYKKQLGNKAVQVFVEDFVSDMYRYSGAADIVITRAGANSLAEFAAQVKACIVVPNHQLTGGHQLKNAEVLAAEESVIIVDDLAMQKNAELLLQQIERLLNDPKLRLRLATNLHKTAHTDTAEKLAELVISSAKHKGLV